MDADVSLCISTAHASLHAKKSMRTQKCTQACRQFSSQIIPIQCAQDILSTGTTGPRMDSRWVVARTWHHNPGRWLAVPPIFRVCGSCAECVVCARPPDSGGRQALSLGLCVCVWCEGVWWVGSNAQTRGHLSWASIGLAVVAGAHGHRGRRHRHGLSARCKSSTAR